MVRRIAALTVLVLALPSSAGIPLHTTKTATTAATSCTDIIKSTTVILVSGTSITHC